MNTRDHPGHAPILVLNSGSSSLKFGLFTRSGDDEALLLEGSAEGIGRRDGSLRIKSPDGRVLAQQAHVLESQTDALQKLATVLAQQNHARPAAVGHRVVHGGPHLRTHQRLTAQVRQRLQDAVHFAPLHIPPALGLIDEAAKIFGDAPHFACFDTAFHATLPPLAAQLALPRRYAAAGVIRYGFHGLSYESLVTRLGADLPARAVFAHLGNGSSVCALRDGKSVDTSMGMTPTGGVPMGTRSGDLDPGVLLYLMRVEKLDADALETLLNRHSGLAGYADGESDMQALEKRAAAGDANAALALDAFATAVRKTIGAYAALLGGIDLLVFTGGIGEHSQEIRKRVCDGLSFLGLAEGDPAGKVRAIHTEEEKQIARHCRALLQADSG
ncbi:MULTISPECIES: acetate/propionate family kinase [Paraburkholderia]|jgi:acetate kinase|uniref:Acetate kinase n=1 Tax=Paraburkholderia terricola TaxID=169427 RepID=A0A1M6MUA0_9BURK|nr:MULTISPECIES: acetate/propionate family kinase [Paraburkholderia]AXE96513.1 acetate/propionate family kinase [Paraburkholderia terricola]ORC52489.1 acetate kinase [Burkholderia sp. A27]SDO03952.1 acetate kinase [Paraburkholderia sediminicola]SHJ86986.1 acetate kinase [Paraburkholderia terricola]